jgi:hypothetical protein
VSSSARIGGGKGGVARPAIALRELWQVAFDPASYLAVLLTAASSFPSQLRLHLMANKRSSFDFYDGSSTCGRLILKFPSTPAAILLEQNLNALGPDGVIKFLDWLERVVKSQKNFHGQK